MTDHMEVGYFVVKSVNNNIIYLILQKNIFVNFVEKNLKVLYLWVVMLSIVRKTQIADLLERKLK